MNKIERMEFLLARMKDGKEFSVEGYSSNVYYNEGNFHWVKPTGIETMNMTLNLVLCLDFSLPPLHLFIDDELAIMRNLPFDYIARNDDGEIWNYECEPFKVEKRWEDDGGRHNSRSMYLFEHIFKNIKFENEESVNRKDYL